MNLFFQLTYTDQTSSKINDPPRKESKQSMECSKSELQMNKKMSEKDIIPNKKVRNEWNYIQARSYIQFLNKHQKYYDLPINSRKSHNINIQMSQSVESRTPKQCYAHHQKMMKRHGSVKAIITKFTYLLKKSLAQPQCRIINVKQQNNQAQFLLKEIRSVFNLRQPQGYQLIEMPQLKEIEEMDIIKQGQQIAFFDEICQLFV